MIRNSLSAILVFLVLGVLFMVSAAAQSKSSEWKDFVSQDGNFKVKLPSTPMESKEDGAPISGSNSKTFELATDFLLYKVGFSAVPITLKSDDAAVMKTYFDAFIKKMEAGEKITALSQKDFRVGNTFGREVRFDQGEMILVNRYIFNSGYFYVLITATYKENDIAPETDRLRRQFLDSFMFLK